MSDDLIDFRCSPLFQNHFHDMGLTPRLDLSEIKETVGYQEKRIKQLQKEIEAIRVTDEEWFANQRRLQDVQAQREQIQVKQNEAFDAFTGIKADSPWKEK